MKPHYLKFESKEQYESLLGDNDYPVTTSVIFPVVTELTGETLTDEYGNEYPESVRKDGFFVNTLGDYPDVLAEHEVQVDDPQFKWAGF